MVRMGEKRAALAVVVLSGGQDSTTCLAKAIQDYGRSNLRAITFDYGQRHRVEIEMARRIAVMAGLADDLGATIMSGSHEIIMVQGILAGHSPLVDLKAKVERYESADTLPGGLEKTFVPMRNQLFLTIAYNRAVMFGMERGEDCDVITGVSQEDYGGYPDCRQSFIDALQRAGDQALNDIELPMICIKTPLMAITKAETVNLSESIPGARDLLAWSHTCYNGQVPPCGHCHACLLRARGYEQAKVIDPLLERLGMSGA